MLYSKGKKGLKQELSMVGVLTDTGVKMYENFSEKGEFLYQM